MNRMTVMYFIWLGFAFIVYHQTNSFQRVELVLIMAVVHLLSVIGAELVEANKLKKQSIEQFAEEARKRKSDFTYLYNSVFPFIVSIKENGTPKPKKKIDSELDE